MIPAPPATIPRLTTCLRSTIPTTRSEACARHYDAAVLEERQESAENHSPREREQQIDDLFGDLINRLFDMWGYAPAETFRHWTPAEEDDFLREIALYCAELDILQETN